MHPGPDIVRMAGQGVGLKSEEDNEERILQPTKAVHIGQTKHLIWTLSCLGRCNKLVARKARAAQPPKVPASFNDVISCFGLLSDFSPIPFVAGVRWKRDLKN